MSAVPIPGTPSAPTDLAVPDYMTDFSAATQPMVIDTSRAPVVPDPAGVYAPAPFTPTTASIKLEPIRFWLPGPFFTYREKRKEKTGRCPVPKGRGKVARIVPGKGFATVTESPRTRAAEKALVEALAPFAPPKAWDCPVRLDADFVFTPPTSGPAWRIEASLANQVYVTADTLGDRDNLHKLLADAMEKAGFFVRDSQIVEGDVRKRFGPEPGYRVAITPLRFPGSFVEWKSWPGE